MRKIVIILFTCFTFLFITANDSNIQQVDAWKLNTHVYSANLILEDIQDQYLDINGDQYRVPDDIYQALIQYPESYRAGSLGPDIFPDLITGQGVIHPGYEIDDISAGDFLELIVSEYNLMPDSHPDKQKVFAFVLGYSLHYAGDLFGHSFVNEYAGKAFPSIEDMANSTDDVQVALRHLVLEGYIDSHVPEDQRTGDNIAIDAPIEFIKKALIERANEEYMINEYVASLVELRDYLRSDVNKMKAYDPNQSIFDYVWKTNYAGYLDEWQMDIDTALTDWVQANHDMASAMLDKESSHSDSYDPILNWVKDNGTSVIGFPDFSLIDGLTEYVNNLLPDELIEEVNEYVKETSLELVKESTGLDIVEFTNAITNPNQFINTDLFLDGASTSSIIDDRLNNFGNESNPNNIEFWPFYNTIIMGKLILLGVDNLNSIFPNTNFSNQEYVSGFNEIKVKINTGTNDFWSFDAKGTDDDVYFYIITKSNEKLSFLLDKPGYNDFESGDTDTYTLHLPDYITKEDIFKFGVRKEEIISDDWLPDWIEVILYDVVIYRNDSSFNKEFLDSTYWESEELSFISEKTISTFDVSIISFIESLDEGNQWVNSKIFTHDKNVFDSLFFGYQAPTINVDSGVTLQVGLGSSKIEEITSHDYLGESLTIQYYDPNTMEKFIFDELGTFEVLIVAKDIFDNSTKINITVQVVDIDLSLNPSVDTIFVGENYLDKSVSVITNLSTYELEKSGIVDTSTPGTYELTYTVSSGDISTSITRVVTVLDRPKNVTFEVGETLTTINFGSTFNIPTCKAIIDEIEQVDCSSEVIENQASNTRTVIFSIQGSDTIYKFNYVTIEFNIDEYLPATKEDDENE